MTVGGFMASESQCICGQEAEVVIYVLSAFLFIQVQDPSPHLGWVFSFLLRQSLIGMPRSWPNLGSPSLACQRFVSLVILDSVKLTAKKNHHMQESDTPGVHSQGQVCVPGCFKCSACLFSEQPNSWRTAEQIPTCRGWDIA